MAAKRKAKDDMSEEESNHIHGGNQVKTLLIVLVKYLCCRKKSKSLRSIG
jgi:hypothetical protein